MQAKGALGLIATNTVAQGDSREVSLDAMVAAGFTITRAIQSRSWPASSANLEYAAVWGTFGPVADEVPRISDGVAVRRISTLLEPAGRAMGTPARLTDNSNVTYEGMKPYGQGFILTPDEAQEWIAADARNAEVLFPYLNGEDLNSRPDTSPSRWVIDFNDRKESEAASYVAPFDRVVAQVKPERASKPKAVREAPWWLFFRSRPALRKAMSELPEVLVIARVSKTVMPLRVSTGKIMSEACVVFATDDYGVQAVLSSSLHQLWAITYGSGMRNDPRYTPSDVFETFPRPVASEDAVRLGRVLDEERREIMLRRDLGLTKLYNLVNDSGIKGSADSDVAHLRNIHVQLDTAVLQAYGYDDIDPGHGFHDFRRVVRWTVSPAARVEILDRLLEENHRRVSGLSSGGSTGRKSGLAPEGETLFD